MKKIFDYQIIRNNRDKIAANIDKNDSLLKFRAKQIINTLNIISNRQNFDQILEINSYTGQLTTELQKKSTNIHCIDFSQKMLDINKKKHSQINNYIIYNEIMPSFCTQFDLITDLCSLYYINNLPLLLAQTKQLMKKNGIFIGTLLGTQTLIELRETMFHADLQFFNGTYARFIPFCDIQNAGMLLQNLQFKNINILIESMQMHYKKLSHILSDLRYIGNPLKLSDNKKKLFNKEYFYEINDRYPKNEQNEFPLTVEFLTIIGHK